MKKLVISAIFLCATTFGGCAVVPPESVKLSSSIGQQLGEIKKSHIYYINAFYGRLESQASRSVDQVFAPDVIAAALNGQSGKVLFERLDAGKNGGAEAKDAILFASRFLTLVRNKVEERREADLKPFKDARTAALANAENAWSQVLQGNSTITAYLASIVKIREAQDQLFVAIGEPEFQDNMSVNLSIASDKIDEVLTKAKDKDAKLIELQKEVENTLNALKVK